jgi:NAD(P)-dependent dehydrogenase (short-subunit alcohol dehydrogenase family)
VSEFYSRKLDLDNLQGQRKYSYFGAYFASELGKVLFTTELARRIKASGVTVVSVSPGPSRTNFSRPSGVLGLVMGVMQHTPMVKPADQAAKGIVWAATVPELAGNSGALYMRGKRLSLMGAANDQSLAARVWKISEQQTGVDPARSAVAAVSAAGGSGA